MSKQTFSTKQELKSLEFGMLLHNIIQQGVYKSPEITISSTGDVSVTGGIFLFYDSNPETSYAVRVEDISCSLSNLTPDHFLFLSYSYSSVSAAEPELVTSSSSASESTKIRLGRIVKTGAASNALQIDTTCMELCGPGYSHENSFVEMLSFSTKEYNAHRFIASFNGKVITNTGVATIAGVDVASFAGLDINQKQYLYIDSNAVLKCANHTVPRFGKLVIAEKEANSDFVINRFPRHGEIGAWNLEVKKPAGLSPEAEALYDEAIIATKNELNTNEAVITLSNLLVKAINHIAVLEQGINGNILARLENLEKLKTYLGGVITIPADITGPATQLDMSKVRITNEVNLAGALTVDSSVSSFGTSTNPIKNLYVTQTLYTDKLFVTE